MPQSRTKFQPDLLPHTERLPSITHSTQYLNKILPHFIFPHMKHSLPIHIQYCAHFGSDVKVHRTVSCHSTLIRVELQFRRLPFLLPGIRCSAVSSSLTHPGDLEFRPFFTFAFTCRSVLSRDHCVRAAVECCGSLEKSVPCPFHQSSKWFGYRGLFRVTS